ncbi:OsmC family protein [Alteribacillus iranensis]|uniref:Uncharacterized OsmC-related protein n=1 Tax=Alteribacillus iranensis TaxID=930128 RepID=A0A1I2FAS6_9BACI|nr:OsmC family protein [Alteribacillus iranensis]SFF02123.1 Uncharacterized OsmC-related protein [Alteribacillus iranensis]
MEFSMKEQAFTTETDFGELQVSSNDEYGFRPYQLLVSSLAVCSGSTLRKIMEKRRQNVQDIHIKTDVTRSEEGARQIEKVHMHFIVEAEGVSETQMKKNLEWTKKNCSMVQSVMNSIEITETFEMK